MNDEEEREGTCANMARPKRMVGVSTKMYFSIAQTTSYTQSLLSELSNSSHDQILNNEIDIFLIPDFISLASVASLAAQHNAKDDVPRLLVGAQDCHHEKAGAFTGEVSPAQLREVGCEIVELGHAERRRLFGETDKSTALKAAAVLECGMVPLVCIGEQTRGSVDVAVAECRVQIEAVLAAVPGAADIVFAYEPVWAIGAKDPAEAEYVVDVVKGLRDVVGERKGRCRFLYGGSAQLGLFAKLKEGVDGLFLGRYAHDPSTFSKIIDEIAFA